MSFYDLLNVSKDASFQQIKSSYKKIMLKVHPDKQNGRLIDNESATNLTYISNLQTAYKTLTDPKLRKEYDLSANQIVDSSRLHNLDGLDIYSLDDFTNAESDDGVEWIKNCPRCHFVNGLVLTEVDLENGNQHDDGEFSVVVQCVACSLCVHVAYQIA